MSPRGRRYLQGGGLRYAASNQVGDAPILVLGAGILWGLERGLRPPPDRG